MALSLPEEPLSESALLALQLASVHCQADAETGEPCDWYHGFWQFMRMMGLAKTSGGHADFLAEELRAVARTDDYPRLLISGSADYSMAAHASWAYRQECAELTLAMIDRCETPLALTRWYGARYGMSITTYRSDILGFDDPRQYDVVVTNSFLGYFHPPARPILFACWARLLRPGGRLILTNRIRPGTGHAPVGFTAQQARAFMESVRSGTPRLPPALQLEPDALARMAQAYAKRFRSVPLRSTTEVIALLAAAGFRIERLDTATATGRTEGDPLTGPTLAEATDYVRVAATRI